MNTIYKLFLFGLLASVTGCDSFLDREPLNQVTNDNYFNSETNANAAAVGMYRTMTSSFNYGQSMIIVPEFSANHVSHSSAFPEYENFKTHEVTAINPWIANMWQGAYTTINAANNIIARVPEMEEGSITDEKRDQFIGEAKFVRALHYFFLVRAFGAVPLKLTPTTEEENIAIPQSGPEEIYEQIVTDLTESMEQLPDAHETSDATKGRATKAAAQALLAKVYLYIAARTGDYRPAAETAKALIASQMFQLVSDFRSIWETENAAESIFELQFDDQTTNPLAAVANDNASMLFYAKDSTVADIFDEEDRRRSFSIVKGSRDRYYIGKFPNANPPSQNLPLLRLAEILLIHAEAEARLNNAVTDEAFNSLKQVLDRAGTTKEKSEFANVEDFVRFVQEEKERELLFEGETWFDLSRTKLALQKYPTLTSENSLVYPIPSSQILLNPALEQNPGY
ncbi:SusD-like starch-binding protein associating with outer membrane [Sphingobacterium allocomposti]|uniref:SusD-like starch-binding protein associating with outer membrane n=1 Tax=Sphingobacterium allocomposti TaxID=415956 RepID=A0A5S5DNZ1_9SPHI|nr:RagB/SusD family nutrient uptake outer membrane protein [Sphingobacterium composti Yoo et al. 2007 non Ten et al. 2007]TYP97627.1 SusD-like starch-binding protein associating with outer membrane [Sphingobacterium composti Yoo et al. 2007 non Ten et al. 2007]